MDYDQNFNEKKMVELKHSNLSPYKPKMNSVIEVVSKNINMIIQKMVVTYKDWHDMLPFSLHV